MPEITLDQKRTALLIADFYADMMTTVPHAVDRMVVEKTQALQEVARQAGILLCYSATVFRRGYIEISDRNKTFSQRKRSGRPARLNGSSPSGSGIPNFGGRTLRRLNSASRGVSTSSQNSRQGLIVYKLIGRISARR